MKNFFKFQIGDEVMVTSPIRMYKIIDRGNIAYKLEYIGPGECPFDSTEIFLDVVHAHKILIPVSDAALVLYSRTRF